MDKKTKVLLAEDDKNLGNILKTYLEAKGFPTVLCANGKEALESFKRAEFDFCILDIMMPVMDGFTLAKEIRKIDKEVPFLFLTAKAMQEDKIHGFEVGADDYLTKPFSMEELLLKIRIFLKRSQTQPISLETSSEAIKIGEFIFHPKELTLSINGHSRNLTFKEVELIRYFAENANKVLSRNEILEKIWGSNDYFLGRSLDVFISRLRKYFKPDTNIKIINLHGIGFRFSIKKEN